MKKHRNPIPIKAKGIGLTLRELAKIKPIPPKEKKAPIPIKLLRIGKRIGVIGVEELKKLPRRIQKAEEFYEKLERFFEERERRALERERRRLELAQERLRLRERYLALLRKEYPERFREGVSNRRKRRRINFT